MPGVAGKCLELLRSSWGRASSWVLKEGCCLDLSPASLWVGGWVGGGHSLLRPRLAWHPMGLFLACGGNK